MSTTNRVLGIVSGFDTETLVNDLMEVENLKLEKLEKERQYEEWEQEAYQEVVSMLTEFQSTYFDVLNSDTNITSSSSFAEFDYSVLLNNESTNIVSVTANGDMKASSHVINSISQLAGYDTWSGNKAYLTGVTSSSFDFDNLSTNLGTDDLTFSLSVGKSTKTITVDNADIAGMSDSSELVTALNAAIQDSFGDDYSDIVSLTDTGELYFNLAANDLTILEGDSSNTMTALGITSGQSSDDYEDATLADLFGFSDSDLSAIEINGVSITLEADDTIEEALTKINDADAGVEVTYDTLNDKFVMKATNEGSANIIDIENGSTAETFFMSLFSASDLVDDTGDIVNIDYEAGQNAKLNLDGADIVMSSNTFTYEGITYELNDTSDEAINIEVEVDTDTIVNKIKNFITDYNNILEHIQTKLSEKKYYDYEPLTDDEKDAMTDDEIELWESYAKSGVLRGASELQSMMTSLRNSFIDKVSGSSLTLSSIGISTTEYSDNGKLTLDEDALTEALQENYNEVVNLFTQESEYDYTDSDERSTRYKENGLGERVNDILKDYVRTTRDTGGYKGILIEKVGIENDSSYYDNYFYNSLNDYDDRIDEMMDFLADKEDYYYTMFANMESALSEMESSYNSLLSSLGS
jgi:flagellar hook-associated protein 2